MMNDGQKPMTPRGVANGGSVMRATLSQDIEQLRKRHTELDRRRAAAQANLDTANANLETLKKQALEAYGTDNLEELKAKLEAMRAENERRRGEYQKHLEEIEARLAEVEQHYQQARNPDRA